MMHGHEKSDLAVVAMKPPNNAGRPVTEAVEPRAGTKGVGPRRADQRASKTHTGRRSGNVCPRRWTACGKPRGRGRRKNSPRFFTT
jgi:RNA-directed DNA polymerase